ncbi:alpha/beta hydrolase family protein [Candidatus Eisenbacteria bacterium]|uniref:Alpha/beta hydrolase family protein n=1 Tax=Eiseniibacteriota bacterium TaxID=2212470 RepID=A0ABV6YKV0_UNCEI
MLRQAILVALIVAFFPLSVCGQSMNPEIVTINSDGLRLQGHFYQAQGRGAHQTLLLIHGWPGSPNDVLGLGERLVEHGLNVLVVSPRGMHESEGTSTFSGTLRDIGASLQWLQDPKISERLRIDTASVILGGHSFGGGMTMAYAATDPSVRRIVSIAGTDHGEFTREYERNESYASAMRDMLLSTQAPDGPVRFDFEFGIKELMDGKQIFGLRENAQKLADRSILLIGGWEDESTTIDQFMLPFYRSLKSAGAEDVTFLVYHDDHGFGQVRDRIEADIVDWIERETPR